MSFHLEHIKAKLVTIIFIRKYVRNFWLFIYRCFLENFVHEYKMLCRLLTWFLLKMFKKMLIWKMLEITIWKISYISSSFTINIVKFKTILHVNQLHHALATLATLATLGSSFFHLRSYHHWTEIKIIMDYFICTINRNRLFHSFVTYFIFLALFLVIRRSFFGPLSFSFFFFSFSVSIRLYCCAQV